MRSIYICMYCMYQYRTVPIVCHHPPPFPPPDGRCYCILQVTHTFEHYHIKVMLVICLHKPLWSMVGTKGEGLERAYFKLGKILSAPHCSIDYPTWNTPSPFVPVILQKANCKCIFTSNMFMYFHARMKGQT